MSRSICDLQLMNTNANSVVNRVSVDVQFRQLPYPYRAMLAICSDLDETPDWIKMRVFRYMRMRGSVA